MESHVLQLYIQTKHTSINILFIHPCLVKVQQKVLKIMRTNSSNLTRDHITPQAGTHKTGAQAAAAVSRPLGLPYSFLYYSEQRYINLYHTILYL
jgi:hypothetical protein